MREILCRSGESAMAAAVLNDALLQLPAALDPRHSLQRLTVMLALRVALYSAQEHTQRDEGNESDAGGS